MRATGRYYSVGVVAALLVVLAAFFYVHVRGAHGRGATDVERPMWTLWQLPPQSHKQQMSYVLRAGDGGLVVIDGGTAEDAEYLGAFLRARGNQVDAWFLTHPHPDHVDALAKLVGLPDAPRIKTIYADLPSEAWVAANEPLYSPTLANLLGALKGAHLEITRVRPGDEMTPGGLPMMVLAGLNPEIQTNAINNSSLVLKVLTVHSILFCGDVGVEGGEKLMQGPFGKHLPSYYVQMAHHGQAAVRKSFYEAVHPTVCLWPTPTWLWENDGGRGPNTGTYTTLGTRAWMEELGVKRNVVAKDGLAELRDGLGD